MTQHLVARSEVGGLNGDNAERASLGASVVASAEQLPTSRKAAVGALDFGRRESGTERRHPAGAKRIDDRLGDWLCCSPFSACGMPECRKRVVLGYRSLARPTRGRYDGQTQDEEARRGHLRTISRRPSTRLGERLRDWVTEAAVRVELALRRSRPLNRPARLAEELTQSCHLRHRGPRVPWPMRARCRVLRGTRWIFRATLQGRIRRHTPAAGGAYDGLAIAARETRISQCESLSRSVDSPVSQPPVWGITRTAPRFDDNLAAEGELDLVGRRGSQPEWPREADGSRSQQRSMPSAGTANAITTRATLAAPARAVTRAACGGELSRGCSIGALGRRSEDHDPHGRDPRARRLDPLPKSGAAVETDRDRGN